MGVRLARNVRKRDHTLHQEPCRRLIVSTTFGPMRRHRARGQLWGFRLSRCSALARGGRAVVSFRTVQGDRATRSPPRSGNTSTPGGAFRLSARRSCSAGRSQSLASPLVLGNLRRDARHPSGLAPPARGQKVDVPPPLTRSSIHRRRDNRTRRPLGRGEPEMGLPGHPR